MQISDCAEVEFIAFWLHAWILVNCGPHSYTRIWLRSKKNLCF